MKNLCRTTAILVGCVSGILLASSSANALTYTDVQVFTQSFDEAVTLNGTAVGSGPGPGTDNTVAGPFLFTAVTPVGTSMNVYCVDLNHNFSSGEHVGTYVTQALVDNNNGGLISATQS